MCVAISTRNAAFFIPGYSLAVLCYIIPIKDLIPIILSYICSTTYDPVTETCGLCGLIVMVWKHDALRGGTFLCPQNYSI